MSYTPTTWQTGDIVTSGKLNKLENGVASSGSALVVHANEYGMLDKTWKEIHDAMLDGLVAVVRDGGVQGVSSSFVQQAYSYDGNYVIGFVDYDGMTIDFLSDSANDYPVYSAPT